MSWLIGAVFVLWAFGIALELLLLLYFFAAIPLSIWIEGAYLRIVANTQGSRLRYRWIIAGNILSALLLVGIAEVAGEWGQGNPLLAWRLLRYAETLHVILGVLSLVILIYGLWPRHRAGPIPDTSPQAAEQPGVEIQPEVGTPARV